MYGRFDTSQEVLPLVDHATSQYPLKSISFFDVIRGKDQKYDPEWGMYANLFGSKYRRDEE